MLGNHGARIGIGEISAASWHGGGGKLIVYRSVAAYMAQQQIKRRSKNISPINKHLNEKYRKKKHQSKRRVNMARSGMAA